MMACVLYCFKLLVYVKKWLIFSKSPSYYVCRCLLCVYHWHWLVHGGMIPTLAKFAWVILLIVIFFFCHDSQFWRLYVLDDFWFIFFRCQFELKCWNRFEFPFFLGESFCVHVKSKGMRTWGIKYPHSGTNKALKFDWSIWLKLHLY